MAKPGDNVVLLAARRLHGPGGRPRVTGLQRRWEAQAAGSRKRALLVLALASSLAIHVAALLLSGAWFASSPRLESSAVTRRVLEVRLIAAPVPGSRAVAVLSPSTQTAAAAKRPDELMKSKEISPATRQRQPSPRQMTRLRVAPSLAHDSALVAARQTADDAAAQPIVADVPAVDASAGVQAQQTSANDKVEARPLGSAAPSAPVAYRNNPRPDYPESARRDEQQGLVVLRVLVSKEGSPIEIKIAKRSGFSVLDSAAVSAVQHWSFVPAQRNQQNIEAWIDIPIRFRLNEGESGPEARHAPRR